MAYAGGSAAAAAAAAIANAVKASGSIVKVEPQEFVKVLNRIDKPLVVVAKGGWLNKKYKYLTNYKGINFYCLASDPVSLPGSVETINAESMWMPN